MLLTRIYAFLIFSFFMFSSADVFAQVKSQEAIFKFDKEWYDFGKLKKGEKVFINQVGFGGIVLGRLDIYFEKNFKNKCTTCENITIKN